MTLQDARRALATFELDFAARVAAQKRVESQALRDAVDREVWALKDAGLSINAICKEYGTKDFNTVKSILARKPVVVVPESDHSEWVESHGNNDYTVHVGERAVRFEWDHDIHAAVWFEEGHIENPDIAAELRKHSGAYTAQIEAI